jgi:amino acid adenylation domain-containing protein
MMLSEKCHLLDKLKKRLVNEGSSDDLVIIEERFSLSFKEMCQIVSNLAKILLSYRISPGDRVALLLDRGIEASITIYSILSIGAVYVPLNKSDPIDRLNFVIEKTGVNLTIGKDNKIESLNTKFWYSINIDEITYNDSSDLLYFIDSIKYNELASILYTSGSTGVPKLVALSHKAMITFADWAGEVFNISKQDSIANLAPFSFDLSVFDLFTSLRFCAKLVFMPQRITMSPLLISKWLGENGITVWYTVPSMLSFWVNKGKVEDFADKLCLRLIMFAGEVFPVPHLLTLIDSLPHVDFYNLYGPVETNVCSYWKVNKEKVKDLKSIPIGIPACNNELAIDSTNNELLVRGPTLMSGYWNNNGLKRSNDWYRTGDCVEVNEKNEYLYKGRLDRMFKYFGFRIEPCEIEAAFLKIPQIKECTVFCIGNSINKNLVSCIVFSERLNKNELIYTLKNFLPAYMIPRYFVELKEIPRLTNGKKNLRQLELIALNKIQKNELMCTTEIKN